MKELFIVVSQQFIYSMCYTLIGRVVVYIRELYKLSIRSYSGVWVRALALETSK